ncbi:MAG: sulfatase-like hydrolase/transferase [bacterium]
MIRTNIPRLLFIAIASLSLTGSPRSGHAESQKATESSPNVIIFLADDLGFGDLACYGNTIIKTPNLDKFATQGLKLTQCYSASAVCSPSRSAILTGRTPYRNGVFTWIPENRLPYLRTSEITSAKLLKEKGYDTGHFGKWHLNGFFNKPEHPQPPEHGFNYWFSTQNNAAPSHKNPVNFVRNAQEVGPLEGFSAPIVVDEAIKWLKTVRDPKKPFFICVWTHEPHLPIESDPQFQAPYSQIENPDIRQHHGNVTQMDHAFGKLMAAVDELKLQENTFIAFTADNGPEGNGDNGRTRGSTGGLRGRKRDVYEGGIRVPGIIRWPGHVKPGTTSDTPVIGSDLFVTTCELTGVKVPSDRVIDGGSLIGLLEKGEAISRQRPLYWRCPIARSEIKTAMRIGEWKIVSTENLSRMELYNLKDDPTESTDLREKNPEKFQEMKKALVSLNTEIEAEGPKWWQNYEENAATKKAAAKKKATTKKKAAAKASD